MALTRVRDIGLKRLTGWAIASFVALALGACGGQANDPNATAGPMAEPLRSYDEYIAEATTIAQAFGGQATMVAQTAVAAQEYLARIENVNAQLAATLRAAVPPTQQAVQQEGAVTPGMIATFNPAITPGFALAGAAAPPASGIGTPAGGISPTSAAAIDGTRYVNVGMASSVRDADGCEDGLQNTFVAATTSRIYLTTRALSIRAGTTISANWLREGQIVFASSGFTVAEDDDDYCIWFYIEPADVPFTAGAWSAQFYANRQAIEPAAAFTISN